MQVYIGNEWISELTFNFGCDLRTVAYLCADHEMCGIISTNRNQAIGDVAWNLADSERSLFRALAHLDRPGRLVRRKSGLVYVGQQ